MSYPPDPLPLPGKAIYHMVDQLAPRPIRQWWGDLIDRESAACGLDPLLVEAIIFVESSGRASAYRYEPAFFKRYLEPLSQYAHANPERVSASYGLMQCMYSTARDYGFDDEPEVLFLPATAVRYGCKHLAWCLKWAGGDVAKAAACYNGGAGNWQGAAPQVYAQKVMARMAVERT